MAEKVEKEKPDAIDRVKQLLLHQYGKTEVDDTLSQTVSEFVEFEQEKYCMNADLETDPRVGEDWVRSFVESKGMTFKPLK